MKFVLENVISRGVRIGKLIVEREGSEIVMDTPLCFNHTRMGFIPNLTPDLIDKLLHKPQAAMLTTSSMYVGIYKCTTLIKPMLITCTVCRGNYLKELVNSKFWSVCEFNKSLITYYTLTMFILWRKFMQFFLCINWPAYGI